MANLLDHALEEAMTSVPGCLAAGYVDLTTGILISAKTATAHPQEVFDLVSAATAGLFGNRNLKAVEDWLQNGREDRERPSACQQIVVTSERLLYLLERGKTNHDHALVFVTRNSDNVGLVMAKSRLAADILDGAA